MSALCRTCRQPIVWAVTQTGKPIPVDPDPTPDGNLLLHNTGTLHAVVVPAQTRDSFAGELHLAHFVTCPDADQHRRR